MLRRLLKTLFTMCILIFICINLESCSMKDMKEQINEDTQRIKNEVEENRPADKLINGILGGQSNN